MSNKAGRTFLLQRSDGAGGFDNLAGITAKSIDINGDRIDMTVPDAVNPEGILWAASIDGVKSVAFSGDGKLIDKTQGGDLAELAMSQGMEDTFRMVVPNMGTYEGVFSINLNVAGADDLTFAIQAASNGVISFTKEP